jgi:hypothetical protein
MTVTLDDPRRPVTTLPAGDVDVDELLRQVMVDWQRRERLLNHMLWRVDWQQRDGQDYQTLWGQAEQPRLYRQILADMIALNKMADPERRYPLRRLASLLGVEHWTRVEAMLIDAPAELVRRTPAATNDQVPQITRRLCRNHRWWVAMQQERKMLRRRLQHNILLLKQAGIGLTAIGRHLDEPRERIQRLFR